MDVDRITDGSLVFAKIPGHADPAWPATVTESLLEDNKTKYLVTFFVDNEVQLVVFHVIFSLSNLIHGNYY